MKPRNKTTDKLNTFAMLDNADTNLADPTPEEVKRVMRWVGKNSGKNMTKTARKERARNAYLATDRAKKKLSTPPVESND